MRSEAADYDLVRPGSLAAVLTLLASEPGQYTPIAGGTELMVQFGAGRLRARKLVDIFNLPELTTITVTDAEITIGAGATYTAIRHHEAIAHHLPLLARAASWTGAIANQNRGTLGGNLVNGSPAADSPPALLAYNADLSLTSVRGTRRIPYDTFHTGYKQSLLAPDELILAIHIPRPTYTHQYLRKVGPRNAQAISKVALGAVANVAAGTITSCRIGLASVAHSPLRCIHTEATLNGSIINAASIARARAALLAEIAPIDDIRSTAKYRAHVSANLLEEFLHQLSEPKQNRAPFIAVSSR
jgi:CO/xanthine dehydrogenase FAD-binding subunit